MKVTTKVAISSLKQNKSRSILIAIAILLTTILLTILALCTNGLIKYNVKNASEIYGDFHGVYRKVNMEKLKDIETHAEFKSIGKKENFAYVESSKFDCVIGYIDSELMKITNFRLSKGDMPTKENEIVGQKEFFESLGYKNPSLGDSIKVPYRIDRAGKVLEKEFIISGMFHGNETSILRKIYQVYVSESFYSEAIPKNLRILTVGFKVNGEESLSFDEMENKIKKLTHKMGIDDKNLKINSGYLMWATDPGTGTIAASICIGVLVILFSVLVIYNIFYVGIIQKVQEYGKLRAIGTTRKQIKRIILGEGMILALFSIPLGLIAGYVGSNLFFNNVLLKKLVSTHNLELIKESLFSIPILILVALVSGVTVYIALKKPMKIASKIPPIEAIKYQQNGKEKGERKGYKSMSLFKLIVSNIMRNKNRTISTILTMGLSCVMFVVIANVASSMNPYYDARHYLEKGDFSISLSGATNDEEYPEENLNNIQKQNLMGEKFIKNIKGINGVSKVETKKELRVKVNKKELDEENKYAIVEVLSKKDFEYRSKFIKRGEVDYEKASQENGIIYEYDSFFDEFGYVLGEELDVSIYDGDRKVTMKLNLQGSMRSPRATYMITEDTFNKLNLKGDMTTKIFITCEKGKEAKVKSELEKLTNQNDFYELKVYEDFIKISKSSIDVTRYPAYGLLAAIGIIGFMNMANTLITSIITRKREIGVLQAIGLTTKQLNKMLQMEGLIFTVGTILIALVVGNPIGYLAFVKLKETGMIGLDMYHFPILELSIMIITLVLLQTLLSFYVSKSLQREGIIDRIRNE